MKYISKSLILPAGVSFLILLTIGIANYPNWKFIFSFIGFIGFTTLAFFDYRLRKGSSGK